MTLSGEGKEDIEVECRRLEEEQVIDRYLKGLLPEPEAEAFEQHYLGCERCFAELRFRHAAAMELGRPISPKGSGVKGKVKPFRPWMMVAAALALTFTAIWFLKPEQPVEPPRSTAMDPRQPLLEELSAVGEIPSYVPVTMRGGRSGLAQERFRQGMERYRQGQHAEALPHLRSALEADAKLLPARFYLGISCLVTDQTDDAIQHLLKLAGSTPNPYQEEAHWYLAKAYFRKKDVVAGWSQLEQTVTLNGPHATEARGLLERLRELEK